MFGSGGEDIAQASAAELGFRYVDHEVIERAAREAGVSEEAVSEAEHIPSLRKRMLQALTANPGIAPTSWYQPGPATPSLFLTSAHYRRFIEGVVREIAGDGEAVVLGHAGQVVLRDRWDTLKVLVTGSTEKRVARVKQRLATEDHAEAEKALAQSDDDRRCFFDRCYHAEWLSPLNYDLCLNTDHMTIPEAVEAVVAAARRR